jgi:hypothetical protein
MKGSRVSFLWKDTDACRSFRTAVSLHSHTLHSREYFDFIPRYQGRIPALAWLIRREAKRHGVAELSAKAFQRAWWTPPLSAREALRLERSQLERLGCEGIVSLTDHDNIQAASELHLFEEGRRLPMSVEWTLPFRGSSFHFGIHNLPPLSAARFLKEMQAVTRAESGTSFLSVLEELARRPGVLIVLNHPFWDEPEVGPALHECNLREILRQTGSSVHALELNGDRPWAENRDVMALAESAGMPVVSGGDRHGCDANPVVNLTNSTGFAEFADEVRQGASDVLFLPRYRESRKLRLFETGCQVIRDYPHHSLGWTSWSDRVFYEAEDGAVRSLSSILGARRPGTLNRIFRFTRLLGTETMRPALRLALAEREILP